MTIIEKILAKAAGKKSVTPGEIVAANIDVAMIHEATGMPTVTGLEEAGCRQVWDPDKVVVLFDHTVPAADSKSAEIEKRLREWAIAQKIKAFYDIKAGVCHQVLPEKGHVRPGEVVVGTDSHTCTYGALGCFGTGIGSTEMAAVFATGKLWFKVPETLKIVINGKLPVGVVSKDLILKILGDVTGEGANYKSIEFTGETIREMTLASRMTMCNMAIEMGAKAGLIEPDEKVFAFLSGRTAQALEPVRADPHAVYERVLTYEVGNLEPQVSCPPAVDHVKPLQEVLGTKIHQAFLGSCTNGRLEDLRQAAEILKGRKIHRDVRMIVIPCSAEVYLDALKEGLIETFIKAECVICNPGCGPCFGGPKGVLAAGEACIASSNRNFRGRMGKGSDTYLASPLVVAASALDGVIADPRKYM
ncbi:3-isopropylmalate dehydratase large subunit [Candidatus Formimonas warabiya]|uniref:3-isopropylmalate dehydratase large subunit n=1 Tax=Formimonas warabiya TaxID=1761012 RepID=A0A3G1KV32_FORW1|nr:3-isopropylmalate dehydratase large subunit [Candidatus Formimonas warabiya]ATW26309.1 3-isopropylmalate dehydratase large subunit [Candidatus Formimonas warabiya]